MPFSPGRDTRWLIPPNVTPGDATHRRGQHRTGDVQRVERGVEARRQITQRRGDIFVAQPTEVELGNHSAQHRRSLVLAAVDVGSGEVPDDTGDRSIQRSGRTLCVLATGSRGKRGSGCRYASDDVASGRVGARCHAEFHEARRGGRADPQTGRIQGTADADHVSAAPGFVDALLHQDLQGAGEGRVTADYREVGRHVVFHEGAAAEAADAGRETDRMDTGGSEGEIPFDLRGAGSDVRQWRTTQRTGIRPRGNEARGEHTGDGQIAVEQELPGQCARAGNVDVTTNIDHRVAAGLASAGQHVVYHIQEAGVERRIPGQEARLTETLSWRNRTGRSVGATELDAAADDIDLADLVGGGGIGLRIGAESGQDPGSVAILGQAVHPVDAAAEKAQALQTDGCRGQIRAGHRIHQCVDGSRHERTRPQHDRVGAANVVEVDTAVNDTGVDDTGIAKVGINTAHRARVGHRIAASRRARLGFREALQFHRAADVARVVQHVGPVGTHADPGADVAGVVEHALGSAFREIRAAEADRLHAIHIHPILVLAATAAANRNTTRDLATHCVVDHAAGEAVGGDTPGDQTRVAHGGNAACLGLSIRKGAGLLDQGEGRVGLEGRIHATGSGSNRSGDAGVSRVADGCALKATDPNVRVDTARVGQRGGATGLRVTIRPLNIGNALCACDDGLLGYGFLGDAEIRIDVDRPNGDATGCGVDQRCGATFHGDVTVPVVAGAWLNGTGVEQLGRTTDRGGIFGEVLGATDFRHPLIDPPGSLNRALFGRLPHGTQRAHVDVVATGPVIVIVAALHQTIVHEACRLLALDDDAAVAVQVTGFAPFDGAGIEQ